MSARTPYAVAARELLRDTLFGAARHELEERPWSEVTMADVAAAAGVSRQTLYKEFGSRDEFAQAFVLREADGFIAAVEGALDAHLDDPQAALTAAFGLFLTAAERDPLIRAAIHGGGEMLSFVTTHGPTLVAGATERLRWAIASRWPQAHQHGVALLSECLVRLAISYATLPVAPAGMTASSIAELLGPFIDRALTTVEAVTSAEGAAPVETVTPTEGAAPAGTVTPTEGAAPVETVTPTEAFTSAEDVTPAAAPA